MIAGVADTHTVLWYLYADARISNTAKGFIDQASATRKKIAVSSISVAEVVYLIEKNRLASPAYDVVTEALDDPDHVFTEAVLNAAIVRSMRSVSRAEVPEMPDRIVAATAVYFDVPVITRDSRILASSIKTVW